MSSFKAQVYSVVKLVLEKLCRRCGVWDRAKVAALELQGAADGLLQGACRRTIDMSGFQGFSETGVIFELVD